MTKMWIQIKGCADNVKMENITLLRKEILKVNKGAVIKGGKRRGVWLCIDLLLSWQCNPVIHLEHYTLVPSLLSHVLLCFTITAFTLSSKAFSRVSLTIMSCWGILGNMFRGETGTSEECHSYGWYKCAAFYSHCGVQSVERAKWSASRFSILTFISSMSRR